MSMVNLMAMKKNWETYALSITMCLLVGAAGAAVTIPAIERWYQFLQKPWFSPPNSVFMPVWTILYVLMGIALARVLTISRQNKDRALGLYFFGAQLVLNFLWSFFFFFLNVPLIAALEIMALGVAIAATIYYFRRIDINSARVMIPYLLWVVFATLLNFGVAILNP